MLDENWQEGFERCYQFSSVTEYALPNTAFMSPKWVVPSMQDKKRELNNVKGLLSKYKLKAWSKHTAYRDPAGFVMKKLAENIQPELLTQAWCKFYEICFHMNPSQLVHNGALSSLHLCEAPGAFVCALNHYLVTTMPTVNWKWVATTLNPNYEGNELSEMIPDDRFIRHTLSNWDFGHDFTGDITKKYNHDELVNAFSNGKVSLVTADGSIDCMKDPGEQERHVEFLHFCETMTALAILEQGGTFVLKIFTMFEDTTINLLYLLNCVFARVSIVKPCTSKSGNSEVYIINEDFIGFTFLVEIWPDLMSAYNFDKFSLHSMFPETGLKFNFVHEIQSCAEFFMRKQIRRILENIHYYENRHSDSNMVYMVKTSVAEHYIERYKVCQIPNSRRILPYINVVDNWKVYPLKRFRDFECMPVQKLVNFGVSADMIDIKIGKRIEKVRNSKFTDTDNLRKISSTFYFRHKLTGLYNKVVKYLGESNRVINIKEFDLNIYHQFQKEFFYKVYNSLNDCTNIIFINIPFHTHFLVGLLYVVLHAFENIYFGYDTLILNKCNSDVAKEVRELLAPVDSTYKKIDDKGSLDLQEKCDVLFPSDIVQVVPPNLLPDSLIGLIWNYNNHLFAKNASYVKRL